MVQNGGTHYFSYLPSHPNFQYLIFQWVASTASNSLQQPPITSTSSDSCSTLHELFKNITIKPTKKCWFLDDLRPFDDLRRSFSGSPKCDAKLLVPSYCCITSGLSRNNTYWTILNNYRPLLDVILVPILEGFKAIRFINHIGRIYGLKTLQIGVWVPYTLPDMRDLVAYNVLADWSILEC